MSTGLAELLPPDPLRCAIFTGCREWSTSAPVAAALILLAQRNREIHIRHGGARGLDRICDAYARALGLDVHAERVADEEWRAKGWSAGHDRNRRMLDLDPRPDLVLAFKDGFDLTMRRGGTENMCRISLAAGVPALLYSAACGWERLRLPEVGVMDRKRGLL